MMQMTVTVKGRPELMRKLRQAKIDVKDMSRELRTAGKYLKDLYAGSVFDSQGSIIEKRWSPLNVEYRKYKQKLVPGKGPLEFSGKMRDSFMVKSSKNQATIYNKASYFKFHQLGTSNIPTRTMMTLDRPRKKEVSDIIFKGLNSRLRRTWRK